MMIFMLTGIMSGSAGQDRGNTLSRVIFACGAVLALAACSNSAVDMLEKGDPHVCTNGDVKDQLFAIVRQNALKPPNNGYIKDYDRTADGWLASVQMSLRSVTSNSVDAASRKVSCDAEMVMNASNQDERFARVSYDVSADLAADGKVIVAADTTKTGPMLTNLLWLVADPILKETGEKKKAADDARAKAFDAKWDRENDGAIARYQERLAGEYKENVQGGADPFDDAEKKLIKRADELNESCRGGSGDEEKTMRACDVRDKLMQDMEAKNICWGPQSAIGADQRWMRCSS